jgi:hypothetical protein
VELPVIYPEIPAAGTRIPTFPTPKCQPPNKESAKKNNEVKTPQPKENRSSGSFIDSINNPNNHTDMVATGSR